MASQEQQPDQGQMLQQKQKDVRWSCEQAKELWRRFSQRAELLASLLQGGAGKQWHGTVAVAYQAALPLATATCQKDASDSTKSSCRNMSDA